MYRNIKAVLIDLSGTLHIENTATKNSVAALQRLRDSELKIKFVTNTTKESKCDLCNRLHKLGFDIQKNEIFSSLTAAYELVKTLHIRPLLMLSESAKKDFEDINQSNPNAVVVGLATNCFNYTSMNEAFRVIMDGASIIAINKSRYYKTTDGISLAAGPFVSALEYASGKEARVIGKPAAEFFTNSIKSFGISASECVMIGDDVKDDVFGAMSVGMKGILVKTGKYLQEDECKITPAPTNVANNFAEAVEIILT